MVSIWEKAFITLAVPRIYLIFTIWELRFQYQSPLSEICLDEHEIRAKTKNNSNIKNQVIVSKRTVDS